MQLQYFQDGESLKINRDKCIGCEMCVEVCPHNVIRMDNKKAEAFRSQYCMECGACARNCPAGAIDVKSGVGCAAAIISGFLNKTEPTCGCSDDGKNKGCGCG